MKSFLENLGLNKKEIEIFMATLELNKQPASIIAKKVNIHRSTTYVILEELVKKQFIKQSIRFGMKYYEAASIEEIINLLEKRKAHIEKQIQESKERKSEFEAIAAQKSTKAKAYFLEGAEDIQQLYQEALQYNSFDALFHLEMVDKYFPGISFWFGSQIQAKKIQCREITINSTEGKKYKKKYTSDTHKVKLAKTGTLIKSDCLFMEDKFILISYGEHGASAVSVTSKDLAESQKLMFEALWSSLD